MRSQPDELDVFEAVEILGADECYRAYGFHDDGRERVIGPERPSREGALDGLRAVVARRSFRSGIADVVQQMNSAASGRAD
jgi:hypothetical protein